MSGSRQGGRKLVLFDIDGTLLYGGPLWRECFEGAFLHCFPEAKLDWKLGFNGKTDPQICAEMLRAFVGRHPENEAALKASVDAVISEYLKRVERNLPARAHEVQRLPGVAPLVERLAAHSEVRLGLLTGNVRRGAENKLRSVGLHGYFEFGVFGDDHADRYELPRLAQQRARERYGEHYSGKDIVVIGDTIHDVNCGKSIGVRAIAVGTGRNVDRNELLAAEPDHYFEDLSELENVLHAILS